MMRQIRVVACVLGLMAVMVTNAALAQGPPPPPQAGPEHQRLHYFVGKWQHEGEMKPGPFGPGGKFTTTEDVHMLGDFFAIFHSTSTGAMGGMEELYALGYDPKLKAYTYDSFNNMGQREKSTGHVAGKIWTWTSDEEMGGKVMKGRFVLTEVSPTSYTYKFDMSSDGKTWEKGFEGKATKVK